MSGFDPELDGTAASLQNFPVLQYPDGTYEVEFPDKTIMLCADWEQVARSISDWVKRHSDSE